MHGGITPALFMLCNTEEPLQKPLHFIWLYVTFWDKFSSMFTLDSAL